MEIGLTDSLQGLRRQAKAYVTLICLSLLLQPPASLYCPIISVTLTAPYCKACGSLMIYLHQGMLVSKWMHKPAVSCIVFLLNYCLYTLFPVVAQQGADQSQTEPLYNSYSSAFCCSFGHFVLVWGPVPA